eukprot:SAG31_NODE_7563_length_1653_cov_1.278636_2_plen_168_part_00
MSHCACSPHHRLPFIALAKALVGHRPTLAALSAAGRRLGVATLQAAGPTFIKLGQWASTRPDLFEPELCQARCQHRQIGTALLIAIRRQRQRFTVTVRGQALGILHASCSAHSLAATLATVQGALIEAAGGNRAAALSVADVFAAIEAAPIGSGCVGQVYAPLQHDK